VNRPTTAAIATGAARCGPVGHAGPWAHRESPEYLRQTPGASNPCLRGSRRSMSSSAQSSLGELIMTDVRVVIVYHSGRGHTAKQAAAVRAGAERVRSVCTLLLSADDVQPHWTDLHSADAIIFGARNDPPVNHLLPKVLPFHLRGTIALGGINWPCFALHLRQSDDDRRGRRPHRQRMQRVCRGTPRARA